MRDALKDCDDFDAVTEAFIVQTYAPADEKNASSTQDDSEPEQVNQYAQRLPWADSVISATAGTPLPADAARLYVRAAWDALLLSSPRKHYRRLTARYPVLASAIDSAAAFGCLASAGRSFGILRHDLVATEWPYKLTLDTATLDEELLLYRLRPGMQIADIGSGDGSISHLMAYLGLHVDATEMRYMSSILDSLRTYMPPDIAERFNPVVATNKNLNLPPGRYDLILARNTVHHLKKRERALLQIREALRPTGTLIVVEEYSDLHPRYEGSCAEIDSFADQRAQLAAAGFRLKREVSVSEDSLLTEWEAVRERN